MGLNGLDWDPGRNNKSLVNRQMCKYHNQAVILCISVSFLFCNSQCACTKFKQKDFKQTSEDSMQEVHTEKELKQCLVWSVWESSV